MSNDRYSAGALAQRLLGLMSCAGLEQRFILYLIFFFLLVWLQEEDGGWVGSAGQENACGFYQGRVAVAYREASDMQG